MAIVCIKSDALEVKIKTFGAEMISIKNKSGREFLWQGSADWEGQAPVLFPIVGALKSGRYSLAGKEYNMGVHGFALKSEFKIDAQTENSVTLLLNSNEETLKEYPFDFEFKIRFTLNGLKLSQDYIILNKSSRDMYYSTGSHESFSCPGGVENYTLIFDEKQTTERLARFYVESEDRYYHEYVPFLENANEFKLSREFFRDEQLAVLNLNSSGISLRDDRNGKSIHITLSDFDTLIGWTVKGGNSEFLCIEPWCGTWEHTKIPAYNDFSEKPGIRTLAPNESETLTHTITFY